MTGYTKKNLTDKEKFAVVDWLKLNKKYLTDAKPSYKQVCEMIEKTANVRGISPKSLQRLAMATGQNWEVPEKRGGFRGITNQGKRISRLEEAFAQLLLHLKPLLKPEDFNRIVEISNYQLEELFDANEEPKQERQQVAHRRTQ